jgi:butyryl-CoA dehydrogenase
MHFDLSEEQKMIQEMTRNLATEKIQPRAAEIDEKGEYPADIIAQMAELGLLGVYIPEEYGGAGMDVLAYILGVEEISRACASCGVIMSVNNSLVCDPLLKNGTDAQKERYLTPLASGRQLGCFGLTEAGAGSDVISQKTVAEKRGDKYILNGNKLFITNGKEADVALIFAMTDKAKKHHGMSAFIVERGFPGYSLGKEEHKLGIRGSSTSEIVMENCEVPAENILGTEGQGFKIAMQTLDGGRIGIAAQALGIAQAALDASVRHAKTREQFGKPIAQLQAIQWMIADMATELDAARLLTYRAAVLKEQGVRFSRESAMAKLFAAESAMRITTKAIQVHGGYGYTREYPVERNFRDAKITEIYEGTSEVQRLVIAAALLKE